MDGSGLTVYLSGLMAILLGGPGPSQPQAPHILMVDPRLSPGTGKVFHIPRHRPVLAVPAESLDKKSAAPDLIVAAGGVDYALWRLEGTVVSLAGNDAPRVEAAQASTPEGLKLSDLPDFDCLIGPNGGEIAPKYLAGLAAPLVARLELGPGSLTATGGSTTKAPFLAKGQTIESVKDPCERVDLDTLVFVPATTGDSAVLTLKGAAKTRTVTLTGCSNNKCEAWISNLPSELGGHDAGSHFAAYYDLLARKIAPVNRRVPVLPAKPDGLTVKTLRDPPLCPYVSVMVRPAAGPKG